MGAVVVAMAVLLIPGIGRIMRRDRSYSNPPKIHLASDARPRSLIQQPEDAEPLCHLLPQGWTPVCLCPSVRLGFELSIPPTNRHAELDPSIAPPADVTEVAISSWSGRPRSPSAVFMVSRRDPRWPQTGRAAEPTGGFGDDPEGFLSAPPLDSAPTRFRAAYR